ncbi:MAG: hypothetical protein ABIG03_00900 [Candidatus Eisenbacteria bacterium]
MRTQSKSAWSTVAPAAGAGFVVLVLATQLLASTVFVSSDGLGDYPDIQAAIDAVPDSSTVYLLQGTYTGYGNRGVVLSGKNVSLLVFGPPGSAVIDCQGGDRALEVGAGVDSTSVIDGITFRNGNARSGSGGAVYCESGGPKILNCSFADNSATYGGALRSNGEPAPIVRGCVFTGNSGVYGGAIDAREVAIRVENSTFTGNSASRGGAMNFFDSSPTISNCTMCMNSADFGAAVKLDQSSALIVRCIVALNRTNEALYGEESSETSYSCVFGNADGDEVDGNAHHNSTVDPLLCDAEGGDYHLCSNSYCLPSGNPWSVHIGHQAQGCASCMSPVSEMSWGALKARYR